MKVIIEFSVDKNGVAFFKYRRWPEYVAAWILGVPIALGYFGFLIYFVVSDTRYPFQRSALFYLFVILAFLIAVIITNAVHFPIINPHWIFTEVRTLIIKPDTVPILRLGFVPVSIQKTIPRDTIEKIELYRHKYGKGLGFFYFWITQGNLHSLYISANDNKRYYLAKNEVKDGWLSDAGRKLSEFLNVPFEENY
jgi:hypothetical protein